MIKTTKIYFLILSLFVLVCIAAGIVVKTSFKGYTQLTDLVKHENINSYSVQVMKVEESDDNDYFSEIDNFKELQEKSGLILKVHVTNERTMYLQNTTKTKVVVKEIYKGSAKKGQEIYVYEPAVLSYSVSKSYDSIGGYQLMKTNNDYYVFLQPLKVFKGYVKSAQENNTYLPSTIKYSVMRVNVGKQEILNQKKLENGEYNYGDVLDQEIITDNKQELVKYQEIKKEFINTYLKNN